MNGNWNLKRGDNLYLACLCVCGDNLFDKRVGSFSSLRANSLQRVPPLRISVVYVGNRDSLHLCLSIYLSTSVLLHRSNVFMLAIFVNFNWT